MVKFHQQWSYRCKNLRKIEVPLTATFYRKTPRACHSAQPRRPVDPEVPVFYNLLANAVDQNTKPANWHFLPDNNPVLEICSHYFLIQHKLGIDLDGKTEVEMVSFIREQSKKYQHIDIVICGGIHDALFEEQQEVMVINPGDARNHRKFVTICFPRCEVTFSSVRLGTNRT